MHRHCIRSVPLQSTEQTCRNFLHLAQRFGFSTTSAALASTPDRPPKPTRQLKSTRLPPPSDGPEDRQPPKKKSLKSGIPGQPNPDYADRRIAYNNAATFDAGYSPINKRRDKTAPTPIPFLNPIPIKEKLEVKGGRAFVAGKDLTKLAKTPTAGGDMEFEEELLLIPNFAPGTFVEIRRNERVSEAIVLAEKVKDHTKRAVCLTATGEIIEPIMSSIHFCVPNLISADLASRCGQEIIPESPQALNARVEALKQLRLMSIQAEQSAQGSRMWDRQNVVDLYEIIKHHDPNQWATVTLEHATSMLYTQPAYVNYYATHKYLMDRPLRYVADEGYIRSQQFRVRPERDVKEIQTVETWITDYRFKPYADTPYRSFIEKARHVLQQYGGEPNTRTGPMSEKESKFSWDESDQLILTFLLRSIQKHTTNQKDPYGMGRNTIVTDITRKGEVTDDTIHNLLIKFGIIAPWQDLFALAPQLNPSSDFSTAHPIEKEAEAVLRASSYPSSSKIVLGPMDFHPRDPLEAVRHDFGNTRVFVIDDPSATELDDGISLERIPSEPDNYWVHVHIADPARILHPRHALSLKARDQFSSVYFTSGNYPMLPPTLMHDPKFGLSLKDSSESTEPNYVLTFSAKLSPKGEILEHKLRAGILQNVRITSYDDVDHALGERLSGKIYPFGPPPEVQRGAPLSESDVADLRILKQLANVQCQIRTEQGIVTPERTYAGVTFETKPPPEIRSPYLPGTSYEGFPEMEYTVGLTSNDDRGSRSMVSEMMKIGCRVASRVALEHDLPFVRRCLEPFVWKTEEDKLAAMRMRVPDNQNYIPMRDFVKFDLFPPVGYYSQKPDAHFQLGLAAGQGYARTTSPLRRYMDLACHWQLHHVLLGPNAPSKPPFSPEDVEKLIIEGSIKDLQLRRLHRNNSSFYALMYIKRYLSEQSRGHPRRHADLLENLDAWTLRMPVRDHSTLINVAVALPELGIDAELHDLPHHMLDLPTGSTLKVKIRSINLGIRRTKMVVDLVK